MNNTSETLIKLKSLLRSLSAHIDDDHDINEKTLNQINKCYQSVSTQIKLPELEVK